MPHTNRSLLTLISTVFLFSSIAMQGQDCMVTKQEIKGTYTGDCKKGKAHGTGVAVGTDKYEGNFKAGIPEGRGTYRWNNGNEYTGEFVNGLKEGKGRMLYKKNNLQDSIVEGYWKKDLYVGKHENPYRIINKSKMVTDIEVEYKTDPYNKITFFITNTSGAHSW